MTNHRQTFHVLRRFRVRQFYRQEWKPTQDSHSNQSNGMENGAGYGILWELDKVDRRIQMVKSEIFVLKQQLKIIKSYCTPASVSTVASSNQLEYSPR